MNGKEKTRLVPLYLIIIYLIWGINWTVMKIGSGYFSPALFVSLRFTVAAVVLLIPCAVKGKLLPERRLLPWMVVSGLFQMGIHQLLAQSAVARLGSGTASVLDYTMPLWVAILAAFALGEKLTGRKIAGILVSIAGLAILMNVGGNLDKAAVLTAICGAICWAVANILIKRHLSGADSVQCTAWQILSSAVVLDIWLLAGQRAEVTWSVKGILCVLFSAILASSVAFLLWNRVLARIEAGRASVAVMGVPAVGVLSGIIFLHEPVKIWNILGMVIIISGILIVLTGKKKA